MKAFSWLLKVLAVEFVLAATATIGAAQRFEVVHQFDGSDGFAPIGTLVQAADGNLYGTTGEAGLGQGSVFKMSVLGDVTSHDFCFGGMCPFEPPAGLIQATDGYFFGVSDQGGNGNAGTVYEVRNSLSVHVVYLFCSLMDCADGRTPSAALLQASDGNLYGTTQGGGTSFFDGTVFKISPNGAFTTLYTFSGTDGARPLAALIQGSDGNLYGTTFNGGAQNLGTIFQMTTQGALTTLHSFAGTDGAGPLAPLVQASDGYLYGNTFEGGASGDGALFRSDLSGNFTTLYSFCSQPGCTDGLNPFAELMQATDGNLYGTTQSGGTDNNGTIFQLTLGGAFSTLYSFCSRGCSAGAAPEGGLLQDTNGVFYGTASSGGLSECFVDSQSISDDYCGTVYAFSMGLGPFVRTNPRAAEIGATVGILGTDLIGATSVTFDGTAAQFTVKSKTLIVATVPSGAVTGTVQVVTPSGTLAGNVPFIVLP